MHRKLLFLLLMLATAPALAQTDWELRIRQTASLQEIHDAYAAGDFSRQQLQAYVDEAYDRLDRYCPNGVGSCDTPERERFQVDLLELFVTAYAR